MKKRIVMSLLAGAFLCQAESGSAPRAGVAFRFDDTKPLAHWSGMAELFERHGCKLSYAINSQLLTKDEKAKAVLRAVSAKGHTLMDHLPCHGTFQIVARDQQEFEKYSKLPFADHADPKARRVFFKYEINKNDPGNLKFQGEIKNGELVEFPKNMAKQLGFTRKIYIPSANKVYGIEIHNGKKILRSFWREKITIPDFRGEMVVLAQNSAVQPPDDVLRFQAETTVKNFQAMNLPLPKIWIQPGGWECCVTPQKIRNIYGKEFSYTAADCVPENNLGRNNSFGDPAPEIGRFTMRPDFTGMDNGQDVQAMKVKIAQSIAKNKVKIFISHMWMHRVKGGWNAYLNGYDELLQWLKKHNIPVKTQDEWAEILYSGNSGLQGNILPSFKNDLDGDGEPDGYELQKGATADLQTGIVKIPAGGKLNISDVAGLTRGTARFSLAAKGQKGTVVVVSCFFVARDRKKNYQEQRKFRLTGDDWQLLQGEVEVKPAAVTLHYSVRPVGKDRVIEIKDPEFKH